MLHPVNDRFKVKLISKDPYGLGKEVKGAESGIVVEVPDMLIYLSFHNFGFENSIGNKEVLKDIQGYYNQFLNKKIYWESLQDRGRLISEDKEEYVYLQMTDLLAYSDDINDTAEVVNQTGKAGSFNV